MTRRFSRHFIKLAVVMVARSGLTRRPLTVSLRTRRETIRLRLDVPAEHSVFVFRAELGISPGVPLPALGRTEDTGAFAARLLAPFAHVAVVARRSARL